MNLLCPNCQKMLQVPEQYAGQLMKCPLCTGTFTVPALPQAPPPPPPPPMPVPPLPDAPAASGKGLGQDPSAAKKAVPAPAGEYAHVRSYTLNPRLLPWVAPLCLIGVFIVLFFPWIGMYPAGVQAVTQNGWQAAFGSYSADEVWMDANRDEMEYLKSLGVAVFLILFVVVVILAALFSVVSVLIHRQLLPVQVPAGLQPVWSLRALLVAALSLAALVFLVLQLASGFPIESATWKQAEEATTREATAKNKTYSSTDEGRFRRKLDEGREYGKFNLQTTSLVTLAVVLMVIATVAAGLDWWVERRGNLPAPRLDISY